MNIAIVGCNRGIGLDLIKQFNEGGNDVYGFCRESTEELKSLNIKNIVEGFDVTNESLMSSKVKGLSVDKFDVVFHVSGI